MPESTQHKLDRIRPPRVQITYDVETRGSFVKMELPFVAGILADLSGNAPGERPALRDRKYVEIDRDNFNELMKSIGPKIQVTGGPELKFENIDDFTPMKVLEKLKDDDVKESFDKRSRLSDMVSKLDGNVKLQKRLLEELSDDTKREAMKKKVDELKALVAEKKEEEAPKEGSVETPKDIEGGKK